MARELYWIRFIPACAGNRDHPLRVRRPDSVHPRVRGEQVRGVEPQSLPDGSSPRARGTVRRRRVRWHPDRFIPACAGNSLCCSVCSLVLSVHPRVRGEQAIEPQPQSFEIGSSPRARGTGRRRDHYGGLQRFIPACAGNRQKPTYPHHRPPVHPRVRGEQFELRDWVQRNYGLSPRARGTVELFQVKHGERRFIPACAGNRKQAISDHTGLAVHTRVRGEQLAGSAGFLDDGGSSPRARGTGE